MSFLSKPDQWHRFGQAGMANLARNKRFDQFLPSSHGPNSSQWNNPSKTAPKESIWDCQNCRFCCHIETPQVPEMNSARNSALDTMPMTFSLQSCGTQFDSYRIVANAMSAQKQRVAENRISPRLGTCDFSEFELR